MMKYILQFEGCEWYISSTLAKKYKEAGYVVKEEKENE